MHFEGSPEADKGFSSAAGALRLLGVVRQAHILRGNVQDICSDLLFGRSVHQHGTGFGGIGIVFIPWCVSADSDRSPILHQDFPHASPDAPLPGYRIAEMFSKMLPAREFDHGSA